nr:odorant-binding protein [Oryctolagus cuniculus]
MVMKMTVTKALLLALTVGVACADVDPAQLSGPWRTSAMASDNLEMILEGGPFRMLFREMECNEECNALNVFFYVKKNEVCTPHTVVAQKNADGIYTTDFEGQTSFQFHELDPVRQIVFINNMGSKGKTSRLSFLVGEPPSHTHVHCRCPLGIRSTTRESEPDCIRGKGGCMARHIQSVPTG